MTTALTTTGPSPLIQVRGDELEVTATTPQEMQESNSALVRWCEHKLALLKAEAKELKEAFEHAVAHKWKASTLKNQADRATKKITFFEKIKAALEAGYYIVPNFPVDVFMIRTDRESPRSKVVMGTYKASSWPFKQGPGKLPIGEGDYKPCDPLVVENSSTDPSTKKTTYTEWATEWGDIDFPVVMAKPTIMEAVSRAMAYKIFDQFSLFKPGSGDPIIVGEIVDGTAAWHPQNSRRVTFIIAWRLDTKDL